MSKKSTFSLLFVLVIMSMILMSCETQGPTQDQTDSIILTQGVSADQINFVEWKPEVVQSLRFRPDYDEANELARFDNDPDIAGADIKFVSSWWGNTVGGAETFGNSVYIPANAISVSRYVAVQVACSDADDLALFEAGSDYLEQIKSELNALLEDLAGNPWTAGQVSFALDRIEQAEVYFQLYSYYASDKAFQKLERDVVWTMKGIAWSIDHGYLDAEMFDHVQNVSQLSVETARELAMTAIVYAQSIPEAAANKIAQALNYMDMGDADAATVDHHYDLEWYQYDAAVRNYCNAWKKATQALNNLDAPCGASVDFLPSQQFQANVTVTLSWEALNFDGNPETLEIFWYNESTNLWVLVPDPVINFANGTISINIDHFTRYAWAVTPPPIGD